MRLGAKVRDMGAVLSFEQSVVHLNHDTFIPSCWRSIAATIGGGARKTCVKVPSVQLLFAERGSAAYLGRVRRRIAHLLNSAVVNSAVVAPRT